MRPPTASAPRATSRSVAATQSARTWVSPSVDATTPRRRPRDASRRHASSITSRRAAPTWACGASSVTSMTCSRNRRCAAPNSRAIPAVRSVQLLASTSTSYEAGSSGRPSKPTCAASAPRVAATFAASLCTGIATVNSHAADGGGATSGKNAQGWRVKSKFWRTAEASWVVAEQVIVESGRGPTRPAAASRILRPSNTSAKPNRDASAALPRMEKASRPAGHDCKAMRRAAQSATPRPRSRRKTADTPPATPPAAGPRNVGSVEALLSLTLGVLMVVAALVPRTFRQACLLALGGGLAYRGLTGNCGVYKAVGIDTAHGSPLGQVGAKLKAASAAQD